EAGAGSKATAAERVSKRRRAERDVRTSAQPIAERAGDWRSGVIAGAFGGSGTVDPEFWEIAGSEARVQRRWRGAGVEDLYRRAICGQGAVNATAGTTL